MSKRRKRRQRAKSPAPSRPSTATPPDPHLAELAPALSRRRPHRRPPAVLVEVMVDHVAATGSQAPTA